MATAGTIYLLVGLPGAGKTTYAKQLEGSGPALRLTPDEWQIALSGSENPPRQRDIVEGRLIQLGLQVARLGTDVILDFGFWSRAERSAIRWIAGTLGLRAHVVYLPIDHEEQRRRVADRFATTQSETFAMTDVELHAWRAQFQPPESNELAGGGIPPAPAEYESWKHWAAERWPSLATNSSGG